MSRCGHVMAVMAASPVLGERVAVVGQGLIGLLVAATLGLQRCLVNALDVNMDRLDVAMEYFHLLGVGDMVAAASPSDAPTVDDLDVVVEVSGSHSGLQQALDMVGTGGRVVIGSWYGETPSPVRLGLKFHRSGVTTISSQASHCTSTSYSYNAIHHIMM